MGETQKMSCSVHGWQDQTFVCQHIAQSLHTGTPVGFHWSSQGKACRPDAWCSDCEEARVEAGGDWTLEVEKKLRVKLLCGACYDYAKSIWLNEANVRYKGCRIRELN
jgi:hypothetical protein